MACQLDLSIRVPTRIEQMEDCKWLREDRLRSKLVVWGQLVDNEERSIGLNPNPNSYQGRKGKDTIRQEWMNYGGEEVRYMELGSEMEEILIGIA
ncbi:hypothetical protein GOBAR_AA28721 [Gossypium barbadense]|uniref:Uncharacterized protein n=1 Tax=Gossypium barbadense TaxID=3634 RepID=A0A2P5WLI6_GOSBA|nr:hypothetical protein GOBAR_AA28721 [Gossypium barbadense]